MLITSFFLLFFQILQKLMEKLTGQQLQVPEVTQSEEGQRNKLRIVLGYANRVLGLNRSQAKWSVDSVHTKNIVSILHLLVRADGRPTISLTIPWVLLFHTVPRLP